LGKFLDILRIIEKAESNIESKGADKSSLAKRLGFPSRYIADIKAGKSKNPGSDFVLALINKLNFNPLWLETGEGDTFLPPKEEKDPLIADLEAIIDKRLEKFRAEFEAQIAEIQGQLKQRATDGPDSVLVTSDPEPEYGEDEGDITFVEGIAAGKPILQSEVRSTIPVPKRYIKTRPEDYYVGRIKGTSMAAAGIPDGVLVLIRYSDVPRDGAIQVVECQGEATLKRMREIPGKGWRICFDDRTGRFIEVGPGDEFYIQGDFVAVLPEPE
jgi:SOS-response transcriptional repressor LexA